MMKKGLRYFVAATLIAAAPTGAQAGAWGSLAQAISQYKKPNIRWGQLEIHPFYRFSESYDSNIYLAAPDHPSTAGASRGVRSSWITKNNVGLGLVLPWHRLHKLEAGYDIDYHAYSRDPHVNNTANQQAGVQYTYAGAHGLTARLGDRYVNTTDQAFLELTDRERRWTNTLSADLDYNPEGGRLAGGVDVSQSTHKYVGPDFGKRLNRYEQTAGFNAGYKIQPKTKLYASYHRAIIHYTVHRVSPADQDKDNKSHSLGFGIDGQIAPKVEGRIEAGMTYREYDEAPVGRDTRVTRNMTAEADVAYKPQERTTLNLTLARKLHESIADVNRFYIGNHVSLDIKHRLPYKFTVGGNVAMAVDKYPETQTVGGLTANRRDDIYQQGAWLEYNLQEWLTTGIRYFHRQRHSTFTAQFNYEDHQTTWNLALKF